ncbi:hypothetical protein [Nesterenkonia ebinurensis]|uniref:hypothetical protein n=1 Tax=Nesterenkonia ebinurensis TaxID=2608252 RepID=UPI00123D45B7|nr:hypothetical protein [Nesterenkonia ebinurensis]
MQPRDYLNEPGLFAEPSMSVKPELREENSHHRHDAVAAELQSAIAYQVKTRIKLDGRNYKNVATSAGMDYKRLYRLLSGKTWIKLADMVGLSYVLSIDLARVLEYTGKEEQYSHYRQFKNARRWANEPILQPHQRRDQIR